MKNEMSSYFEDPEFKESLAKYEGMVESHTPAYFDADELTDIAEYYASNERQEDADNVINFALKLHPNDTDALIFRARSLAIRGKLEEAYTVMDLIEDQSDREVKFLQADLLMEEGRMEEADQIFDQLIATEENEVDTYLDIIVAYLDANQEKLADNWVKRLNQNCDTTALMEKSQRFRDTICDFYVTFNKPSLAIPFLKKTLDLNPYSTSHWNDLGKCQLTLGNIEEAQEALDFALAIDDKNRETLALKAFCYRQSGNLKKTAEYYLRLAQVSEKKARPYLSLVKIYIDTRDYVSASRYIKILLQYIDQLTEYELAEVYCEIALCHAALQHQGKGDEYIAEALEINGADPDIQINAGRYYILEERKREALTHFEQAVQLSAQEDRYDTLFTIASICFDRREFNLAINYYEQINQEFPDEAKNVYFFMIYSYFYLKQIPLCMRYLALLRKEVPELYDNIGVSDEIITLDEKFSEFIQTLKTNINKGILDLDQFL